VCRLDNLPQSHTFYAPESHFLVSSSQLKTYFEELFLHTGNDVGIKVLLLLLLGQGKGARE